MNCEGQYDKRKHNCSFKNVNKVCKLKIVQLVYNQLVNQSLGGGEGGGGCSLSFLCLINLRGISRFILGKNFEWEIRKFSGADKKSKNLVAEVPTSQERKKDKARGPGDTWTQKKEEMDRLPPHLKFNLLSILVSTKEYHTTTKVLYLYAVVFLKFVEVRTFLLYVCHDFHTSNPLPRVYFVGEAGCICAR